jgi:hypothetical protein
MRRFALPALWMLAIAAMSSTVIGPRQFVRGVSKHSPVTISESSFAGFWQDWWWLFVKGFHVLEFALLGFLLLRAMPRRPLAALAIATGFAIVDELHQTLVPARGGRLSDVGIDLVGVLLGWLVWCVLSKRKTESTAHDT